VHEFNVKAVLGLFLPYHETPQFAQMLQLLQVDKVPELKCLVPVKKALQTLPRHTLASYMLESPAFMTFVVTLLPVAIKKKTYHRALLAFWTASLVSYINGKDSVSQEELGVILPAVYSGIRSKAVPELQVRFT
jgi:U3 small nucleolar RNA-associated protein 10